MGVWRKRMVAARIWHALTAAVIAFTLALQIFLSASGETVLIADGEGVPDTATRMVNLFSYFTVQSNILLGVAAATLVADPRRDGPVWRVLRIAGLVGITVTGIVYLVALRGIVELDGLLAVSNAGFHYVSPVLGVAGWLLFGPRPRLDWPTLAWSLAWPVLWLAYTLVRGAAIDWYPYPFLDVDEIGAGRTALNCLAVTALLVAVGALYLAGDRRLVRSPARAIRPA